MKKIAIIIALLLFQTQVMTMAAANYNKKPAKKAASTATPNVQKPVDTDSTYLLKYNIDDLEAAPWLNNGKRTYKK